MWAFFFIYVVLCCVFLFLPLVLDERASGRYRRQRRLRGHSLRLAIVGRSGWWGRNRYSVTVEPMDRSLLDTTVKARGYKQATHKAEKALYKVLTQRDKNTVKLERAQYKDSLRAIQEPAEKIVRY